MAAERSTILVFRQSPPPPRPLACGAGTTTKVLYPSENRIERAENVKEVEQYISRVGEMMERKERLMGI